MANLPIKGEALNEQALRILVAELERSFRETWAVHVAFTEDLDHPFKIVKVEQWPPKTTKVSRFDTYDIHRVEAVDELGAYAAMRRTLAKLEPPKCS